MTDMREVCTITVAARCHIITAVRLYRPGAGPLPSMPPLLGCDHRPRRPTPPRPRQRTPPAARPPGAPQGGPEHPARHDGNRTA
jgi:hypothetical protein